VSEDRPPGAAPADGEEHRKAVDASQIRQLRVGHGANCSSIGSVVDTLFATATVGAALLAAVVAALKREDVKTAPFPRADDQHEDGR
jgi:hypothetical protein